MKRVLLVCNSQSGQLRRCADAFLEPMKRAGFEVDVVSPQPTKPYPWPWSFSEFLDVFPECVRSTPPAMDTATLQAPQPKYDLVVLAYQVWYLAPALPVVGWLESDAANVLKDTPVIALCACRNMWQRAFVQVKKLVSAKGGRIIDHVVREDSGPAWATFWSTPRWVMTGDRVGATGLLPVAGISDADISTLAHPGAQVAEALARGQTEKSILEGSQAPVHRLFVIPELVGRFFFERWAGVISSAGRFRGLAARVFFFSLCSSLPFMIPAAVVALFIRLLARQWFQGKVDEVAA